MSSRFEELLERLEADIETVHGGRLAITWRFRPGLPKERRWIIKVGSGMGPVGGEDVCPWVEAHDGETPLRRMVEQYSARAHLVRERAKAKKK